MTTVTPSGQEQGLRESLRRKGREDPGRALNFLGTVTLLLRPLPDL